MSKTEYRIIPCRTFIADMYLQFKDIKVIGKGLFGNGISKEVWRFVPISRYAVVVGTCLDKSSCPTSNPEGHSVRFLNCNLNQESYELIPFTKKYPDIEVYFEELREERIQHLKREADKNNAKTIYL